jgi:hypothetical protein
MGKFPIRRSHTAERTAATPVRPALAAPSAAQRKPSAAPAPPAVALQRAALLGHSVQRVAAGVVQAKLTLGPVGDTYEREADSVAEQVVQQINSPAPAAAAEAATPAAPAVAQRTPPEDEAMAKPLPGAVQRNDMADDAVSMKPLGGVQRAPEDELKKKPLDVQRAPEDELKKKPLAGGVQRAPEDELKMKPLDVQRAPEDELKKKPLDLQRAPEDELKKKPISGGAGAVQREGSAAGAAGAEGGPIGADLERSIDGARSGGSALDSAVRVQMEPAFGADFSGVRVHSDAKSHQLNDSLQARAFTTGQDIFFRGGEYRPQSSEGKELLAHELTHVVQQNGPAVAKKPA